MDDRDEEDIRLSRAGDGESYARLIRRYQSTVARRMTRFSRQPLVIEELVQDTFVEAYISLASFKGKSPFENWLLRIATRVGYRHWKRQRRQRERETPITDEKAIVSKEPKLNEAAELVYHLLEKLPPRDRLVLTLMYVEGLSVAEVAAQTGWTKTMVKAQAFRARRRARCLTADSDLIDRRYSLAPDARAPLASAVKGER